MHEWHYSNPTWIVKNWSPGFSRAGGAIRLPNRAESRLQPGRY